MDRILVVWGSVYNCRVRLIDSLVEMARQSFGYASREAADHWKGGSLEKGKVHAETAYFWMVMAALVKDGLDLDSLTSHVVEHNSDFLSDWIDLIESLGEKDFGVKELTENVTD